MKADQMVTRILKRTEWQSLAEAHRASVSEWTVPYRSRRASGQMHPIYDFLFIYYRNKPSHLEAWHPGFNIHLADVRPEDGFSETHYTSADGLYYLDGSKMNPNTRHRLEMALKLCETVRGRPPQFGCFGLHEWAMVYRGDTEGEVRHAERLPLRLSQEETDAVVQSRPIVCSHFDAFRFFNPKAKDFNRMQPSKDTRLDNEQCGCLHTNMDLYKLAAQCMPWIGSDMLWQCFEFALKTRQLDMQASPYDCSSLGFAAVKIETPEGRLEYERRQRELSEEAKPIRDRLIHALQELLAATGAY